MKLRIRFRASISPLRGYAQHERHFSARPERSVAKSKDERNANFAPLVFRAGVVFGILPSVSYDPYPFSVSPLCLIVFLCALLWTAAPRLSWAQESVLDEGPMPDTVQQLPDPLGEPFKKPLPLPWLLLRLRRTLRDALQWEARTEQPFFRDTALTLKLRTFYYNRDTHKVNAADSINEAWALGGSLAYQSGWYKDFLSVGAEVFTSQKLYGPRDRDGTLLLRPGQHEYTVVGQTYAQLQYKEHLAVLYRQYFDLP